MRSTLSVSTVGRSQLSRSKRQYGTRFYNRGAKNEISGARVCMHDSLRHPDSVAFRVFHAKPHMPRATATCSRITGIRSRLFGIRLGRLSSKIETINVHHLRPCGHKVLHELLLRIAAAVDLGKGAELGVRSKDTGNHRGRPLQVACAGHGAAEAHRNVCAYRKKGSRERAIILRRRVDVRRRGA